MEPAREEGEERGSSRKWIWALLIALGIAGPILTLGLLATFVLPNIVKQLYVANTTKAMADIASIARAADDYAVRNNGRYPNDLQVLVVPDVNGATFLEGTTLPLDPWGRAYGYEVRGDGARARPFIFTYGSDGQPGGVGEDRDIDSQMIRNGDV